jgi:ribulose-phosphate 3-epimerase
MSSDRPVRIAPSLLSADFASLAVDLKGAEAAGADWHHVDVMDGHFVPNITIGPCVVEAIRKVTSIPLDVHIMIQHPLQYAGAFCKAGADVLAFHLESQDDPVETATAIRGFGTRVGVALNPDTPIEHVEPLLDRIDMVLVMSVFPGFAGQSFIRESLDRIRVLRTVLGWDGDVQIDGGIAPTTIGEAAAAGADVFVAGTAVYGHPGGVAEAISGLRELAEKARHHPG